MKTDMFIQKELEIDEKDGKYHTAQQWYELARKYYDGNGKTKDRVSALICFQRAIDFVPNHINSLYYLGLLHQYGENNAIPIDLDEARKYYKKAEDNHDGAKKQLLIIESDEWNSRGDDYFDGKNHKLKDLYLARLFYQQALALNPNHIDASFNLGWLYQYGHGVDKDLNKAREYYLRAAPQDHDRTKKQLLIIENSQLITADQWNSLGDDYYEGKNNKLQDRSAAFACFEQALAINPNSDDALHHLGHLYQYGLVGDNPDYEKAKEYFDKAAAIWFKQAEGKYYGHGVPKDYKGAFKLYELTIKTNPHHSAALYCLGYLYEKGEGIVKNYPLAVWYYHLAIQNGSEQAQKCLDLVYQQNFNEIELEQIGKALHESHAIENNFEKAERWYKKLAAKNPAKGEKCLKQWRKDFKEFEKNLIVKRYNQDNFNINEKDVNGNTALHRAAKNFHLKNCARLLFLGHTKDIKNKSDQYPMDYLKPEQRDDITMLQTRIVSLRNSLSTDAYSLITRADNLVVEADKPDQRQAWMKVTEQALKKLSLIDAIKPVLELTKFAVLGLHNRSGRKFAEDGYDSDEDLNVATPLSQFFQIVIDANSSTVDGMCHYGEHGRGGTKAVGLSPSQNVVYIAAKGETKVEVISTIIHELIHFTVKEIFNHPNPYNTNDTDRIKAFGEAESEIKKKLELKPQEIDEKLKDAVSKKNQEKNSVHSELIARAGEMIATYYKDQHENGLQRLKKQAPKLLDYYLKVFLPDVENHIEKLLQRATRGWPLLEKKPDADIQFKR